MLAGDFNATPWSPFFRDFLRHSRVSAGASTWSLNPTWPAGSVGTVLLRIPLDHCRVSADLAVVSQQVGPDIGSDHFPLQTDLAIPSGAPLRGAILRYRSLNGSRSPLIFENAVGCTDDSETSDLPEIGRRVIHRGRRGR